MPAVPAFCDTPRCRTVFFTNAMVFNDCANVTIHNCKVSPCPKCGGTGHLLDGTFNFVGNEIQVLAASETTRGDLRRLEKIFRDAEMRKHSAARVAARIKKEAPAASGLMKFMPKDAKELGPWIALVAAIIKTVATSHPAPNISQTINNVQVTVNQSIGRGPL